MALVDVKNIPSTLFDQLLALNDLVQALKDTNNLNDIVSTLRTERDTVKKQYDDLAALKVADDLTTKNLNDATAKNNQSVSDLEAATNDANVAKANSDAALNKAQLAQKSLAQSQSDFYEKVTAANSDLDQREKAVSVREDAAKKSQADADAMRQDYQDKLDNLKKLTGG